VNADERRSAVGTGTKVAMFKKQVRKGVLEAAQFPDELHDADGTITKPHSW
jgi:hypothetical protein